MSDVDASARPKANSWTVLLAGAVAHDINNFVHGLSTASAAAERSLENIRELVGEVAHDPLFLDQHLGRLRKLGARLRVMASAEEGTGSVRLDQSCADALAEAMPLPQQVLDADPIPSSIRVSGMPAAVRAALASLVDHALSASPEVAKVRLSVEGKPPSGMVGVRIAADDAWTVGPPGEWTLEAWLGTARRDLRGDFSLVLAGAMAAALGGIVRVATRRALGLVLILELPTAPPTVGSE